jgi:phosphoribosylformimino-5-aminoimidazole carboxamide ribotide isomerase
LIIVPAVDLRGGRCVRLYLGQADAETVFSEDPIATARNWVALGAERLHVVDLDGAFAGEPRQTTLIKQIIAAVAPVPVEVGGGLREPDAVAMLLDAGATWVVLGTGAVLDPEFLDAACQRWPGRIIAAVDARGDRVAVRGWTATAATTVVQAGRRAEQAGAAALLYTDVSRDGTEQGPNVEATAALAESVRVPILASGGVARVDDLVRLAAIPGVAGTVVGRALYSGAIDLPAAIAAVAGRSAPAARPSPQ